MQLRLWSEADLPASNQATPGLSDKDPLKLWDWSYASRPTVSN